MKKLIKLSLLIFSAVTFFACNPNGKVFEGYIQLGRSPR